MKKKILIVGLGGMGVNYFRAFDKFYNVYGLDKKKRVDEIDSKNILTGKIFYNFNTLPKKFDLIIIATTSNIRFSIFRNILKKIKFNHLIFEKILFNSLSQYSKALKLINNRNLNLYVNCTNRMYSYVDFIKRKIKSEDIKKISMTGNNWGLCCNYIHYIDLFLFILGKKKFDAFSSKLSNQILESRRKNFFELYGELKFKVGDKIISIKCNKSKSKSISYKLNIDLNKNKKIIIDEINNKLIFKDKNISKKIKLKIPYTSDVILKFYNNISKKNKIKKNKKLVSFEDSIHLHVPVLKSFNQKFKKLGIIKDNNLCPIT